MTFVTFVTFVVEPSACASWLPRRRARPQLLEPVEDDLNLLRRSGGLGLFGGDNAQHPAIRRHVMVPLAGRAGRYRSSTRHRHRSAERKARLGRDGLDNPLARWLGHELSSVSHHTGWMKLEIWYLAPVGGERLHVNPGPCSFCVGDPSAVG